MRRMMIWTARRSMALAMWTSLTATAVMGGVTNPGRESPPAGIGESAVAVGASAPGISLESAPGGRWVLADALKDGPVVLVFYRGDW